MRGSVQLDLSVKFPATEMSGPEIPEWVVGQHQLNFQAANVIAIADLKLSMHEIFDAVVIRVFLTNDEEVLFATGDSLMPFLKDSDLQEGLSAAGISAGFRPALEVCRYFAEVDANCASISLYRLPHSDQKVRRVRCRNALLWRQSAAIA
jgi:hypothetical protein